MKKMIESLLENLIYPLLVLVLSPMAVALGSTIVTGNWREWFGLIPKGVWGLLLLGVFAWGAAILVRKRLKQIRKSDVGPLVGFLPRWGWIAIGEQEYAGVIWEVRVPKPDPYFSAYFSKGVPRISPSEIDIATPPRCPNCGTELEQSRSFFIGYVWKCVRCGFKKRNRDSFFGEAERVERIARREWEVRYRDARSAQG